VPILLHADDQEWVMRPDPAIRFWHGETAEPPSATWSGSAAERRQVIGW